MDQRTKLILLSMIAAGAGATAIAYMLYVRRQNSTRRTHEVNIEKIHKDWISKMAQTYTGGDTDKVANLLIDYCIEATKDDDEASVNIFKRLRCSTCGNKKNKVEYTVSLAEWQYNYLENMIALYKVKGGLDKMIRIMFEYGMRDADLDIIFTTPTWMHIHTRI